jgi:DNA polymerase III delta prime subunit
MALAFAEELPATLHHVSSQKADVAALDRIWDACQYCPTRGRFHVIILDEADEATEKAQVQLLSKLDAAATLKPTFGGGSAQGDPPPILWIFTANGVGPERVEPPYSFEKRFLSRCILVPFPRPSDAEIASYLAAVHKAEGYALLGEADFLAIASVSDGMRTALMKLESCHLRGAREFKVPPKPAPVEASPVAEDRDSMALSLYGRPYADLIPAHRAWVTMRLKQKQVA